jgi:hypothetical protein
MASMSEHGESLVVIVRVWREAGEIRARVVHGEAVPASSIVVSSVDELAEVVRSVVAAWDRDGSTCSN